MKKSKCDGCIYSRPVVSENGIHSVCCLSSKKAVKCITHKYRYFEKRIPLEDWFEFFDLLDGDDFDY